MTQTKQNLILLIFKNSLWNGGSRLVLIFLNLLIVPVFIGKLGADHYGIYVLIMTLLSVLQLLCLGAGEAAVKYMAESEGTGERRNTELYFQNALFCFLLASVTGIIILTNLSEFLTSTVLKVAPNDQDVCRISLIWFSLGWLMRNLAAGLWCIPIALQRYDVAVPIRDGEVIVERLLSLAVVILGGGLVQVFQVHVVTLALAILVTIRVGRRLMPGIRMLPRFDAHIVSNILQFGIWQSLSCVTLNFRDSIDRWFIGIILSPSVVGYYNAVMTVGTSIQGLVSALGGVLFPTFSRLYGQDAIKTANQLFIWGSWALNFVGVMFYIPAIIFGRQFLAIWLGGNIDDWMYRVLVIALAANIFKGAGMLQNTFLAGIGRTNWNATIGLIQLVLVGAINWALLTLFAELGLGWANFSIGLVSALAAQKMRTVFFKGASIAEYYTGLFSVPTLCLMFVAAFIILIPSNWIPIDITWHNLFIYSFICAFLLAFIIILLSFFFPGSKTRHDIVSIITNSARRILI